MNGSKGNIARLMAVTQCSIVSTFRNKPTQIIMNTPRLLSPPTPQRFVGGIHRHQAALSRCPIRWLAFSLSLASCLAAENNLTLQTTLLDSTQIQITVTNQAPDVICRVDASTDLKSWAYLISSNSPTGGFVFSDQINTNSLARFYRAAETGEIIGQVVKFGNGTIRSWARAGSNGVPTSIGVTLTEGALTNTPAGSTSYVLLLPPIGTNTPFKHIWVNWEATGHPPVSRYGVPHFDFHFYTITPTERSAINLSGGGVTMYKLPAAEFVPKDFVQQTGQGVPQMGAHWADTTAPELNGQPFSRTFIHGSYDGTFIFWEPMITLAFLKTKPAEFQEVKQPQNHAVSGPYPLRYGINYSAAFQEYTVSLDDLTAR